MTTYNTGNPIGSTAVKDLYDNAENLDAAVNTRTAESWNDRFGVARKTWWGMEQDFQRFLINSGYENIGDYGPGLEITARNQIFWRDGELYRAGAALELPYTTTGDWGDEEGLFVAVGDQSLRQELADPEKGAGMVGFKQAGADVIDRDIKSKLQEQVSVLDFGLLPDGSFDSTLVFERAAQASKAVYVPYADEPYEVTGLNVDFGVRIYGHGKIKTSSGRVVDLSQVNLNYDTGPLKIMLVEGALPSWEEMLEIKSLGYNTVMGYRWHFNQETLIKNCEAVGLFTLVHCGNDIPETIVPLTQWDDRESVVGYYLLDEPVINDISVSEQDRMIAAYRDATSKPLYVTENAVIYGSNMLSSNFDVIMSDVYYSDSYTTANEAVSQYVRNIAEYLKSNKKIKHIPMLGLFNDPADHNQSKSRVIRLAQTLLPFSPDGSFAMFAWTTSAGSGFIRDDPDYYKAAKDLITISRNYEPYDVHVVSLGSDFGSAGTLHSVFKNTTDGSVAGLPGEPYVFPWEVVNAGSAVDGRQQAFSASGLFIRGPLEGTAGFKGVPAGLCVTLFRYHNRHDGSSCRIDLGTSSSGGYAYEPSTNDKTVEHNASVAFEAQLADNNDLNRMPMVRFRPDGAASFPLVSISGYMVFTNIPEYTF